MKRIPGLVAACVLLVAGTATGAGNEPIKIAHVFGITGPFAPYAQQLQRGMQLGFEYATNGTNKVLGRPLEVLDKDTHLKPGRGRALAAEAYGDDDAAIVVGPASSAVALAMIPVAERYKRIIMPEGVADSITGSHWNRYVVRVARNSTQDAIASAVAIGGKGSCVGTIAQDYAFGHEGVGAFRNALESSGGRIVQEEYVAMDAKETTAPALRLIEALRDAKGCTHKYIWPLWAGGGNPLGAILAQNPSKYGITISTGGNILPVMKKMHPFAGSTGAIAYYYELPNNPINDWLVKEHLKRYNEPPDFFTAQGMSEAIAIVAAIKKAGSTDTEKLIKAFEGLKFQSPKGEMYIRPEDHQAMQNMYQTKLVNEPKVAWVVPKLVRVIKPDEIKVPITNQK